MAKYLLSIKVILSELYNFVWFIFLRNFTCGNWMSGKGRQGKYGKTPCLSFWHVIWTFGFVQITRDNMKKAEH
jgi:hypothetical protein